MKKVLSLVLTLAMVSALAGCAGSSTAETTAESAAVESTAAAEESTAAESTEAAETETEAASETAAESAGTVLSYDEYMAAELDTEVTVEAYVQATQSWWEDSITVYAQDENGGYFFYNLACSEEDAAKLVPGTKIRVTGYKAEWSGEVEIMDGSFEFVEGADTFVAEPLDVTAMLGTDELIDHQNEFVSFTGMTVEAAGQDADGNDVPFLYNWDGSGTDGDDLYFNVSYNGETYTFTIESYLCDNTTDVYAAVKNLQIGDVIDMQGFLYWYEGVNPHITSVTASEAAPAESTSAAETEAAETEAAAEAAETEAESTEAAE